MKHSGTSSGPRNNAEEGARERASRRFAILRLLSTYTASELTVGTAVSLFGLLD